MVSVKGSMAEACARFTAGIRPHAYKKDSANAEPYETSLSKKRGYLGFDAEASG
jgi:hypothetical protein